jgi:hypothetical protein
VRRRRAPTLPWTLWSTSFVLIAGSLAFAVVNRDAENFDPLLDGAFGLSLFAFPTVGAVISSRRPRNAIGWIFLAAGVPFALTGAVHGYATYALFTEPGSLPGAEIMAWLASWIFLPPLFAVPAFLFLLFPDGKALAPRWRVVGWMAAAGIASTVLTAFAPGPLEESPFEDVVNPLGVEGAESILKVVGTIGWASILVSILGAAASMLVRFRRAKGLERQQLKWIASAAGLFALANVVGSAIMASGREEIGQLTILLALAGIPIAAGVAILRYRLYNIDRILNRALVYGALTALLAGAYLGIVVTLQNAIPGAGDSDLTIAGTTLAVAALFRPLRSRVQGFIDRRFYRRRYDAQQTLEHFTARLRNEIDLEALNRELVAVVSDTMQPAHASLWLRPQRGAAPS